LLEVGEKPQGRGTLTTKNLAGGRLQNEEKRVRFFSSPCVSWLNRDKGSGKQIAREKFFPGRCSS